MPPKWEEEVVMCGQPVMCGLINAHLSFSVFLFYSPTKDETASVATVAKEANLSRSVDFCPEREKKEGGLL